jgi:hypothetical protein
MAAPAKPADDLVIDRHLHGVKDAHSDVKVYVQDGKAIFEVLGERE